MEYSAYLWKKYQLGPLPLLGKHPLSEALGEKLPQTFAQEVYGTDPYISRYAVRSGGLTRPYSPDGSGKFVSGYLLVLG